MGRVYTKFIRVLVIVGLFSTQLSLVAPAYGQGTSNCQNADFLEGINRTKTKIEVKEDALVFSVTTNSSKTCIHKSKPLEKSGIPVSDFADPTDLFSVAGKPGVTFSAYAYGPSQMGDRNILISYIVSEDKAISNSAQYQGLFFKFTDEDVTLWDRTKYYQSDNSSGKFAAGNVLDAFEGSPNFDAIKAKYKELFLLQGKKIEGVAATKQKIKVNIDYGIDYTGSEVGNANPPHQPVGENAWQGSQDNLPGLVDAKVALQLWRKSPGTDNYKFYRSYKIDLSRNPSDGKFWIDDELLEGDYTLTSFLQITYNGDVLGLGGGYTAQMLVSSKDDSVLLERNQDLDSVIGESKDDVFYREYLGLINRGRADLFIAQDKFSVTPGKTTEDISSSYKFQGSTNDVYKEILDQLKVGCSIVAIMAAGDIGDIFSKMIDCLFKAIFRPMIDWATDLVQKAAGVSYSPLTPSIFSNRERLLA